MRIMLCMTEGYRHLSKVLFEHAVSSGKYSLKQWNQIQMMMIRELEKRHLINSRNIDQVLIFAKRFSDFVDDNNRIPTINEMIEEMK